MVPQPFLALGCAGQNASFAAWQVAWPLAVLLSDGSQGGVKTGGKQGTCRAIMHLYPVTGLNFSHWCVVRNWGD